MLPRKTRNAPDHTLVRLDPLRQHGCCPVSGVPLNPRVLCQVLDLDETLVHCSTEMLPGHDFTFSVNFNGEDYTVYVRKRPYFEHFLSTMSKLFEIVVCG